AEIFACVCQLDVRALERFLESKIPGRLGECRFLQSDRLLGELARLFRMPSEPSDLSQPAQGLAKKSSEVEVVGQFLSQSLANLQHLAAKRFGFIKSLRASLNVRSEIVQAVGEERSKLRVPGRPQDQRLVDLLGTAYRCL